MDTDRFETLGKSPAQDVQSLPDTTGNVSGEEKIISEGQEHTMKSKIWQELINGAVKKPIEVTDDEYKFVMSQLEALQSAWRKRDYGACKEPLWILCEQVGYDKLRNCFLTCIPRMAWFLEIFRKTQIHITPENPCVRAFYKNLNELFETHMIIQMGPEMLLYNSRYNTRLSFLPALPLFGISLPHIF